MLNPVTKKESAQNCNNFIIRSLWKMQSTSRCSLNKDSYLCLKCTELERSHDPQFMEDVVHVQMFLSVSLTLEFLDFLPLLRTDSYL